MSKTQQSCKPFGKNFSNMKSSQAHLNNVHKPKEFKCIFCEKAFSNNTGFTHHMSAVHDVAGRFPCKVCHKQFHIEDEYKKKEEPWHKRKMPGNGTRKLVLMNSYT